MKVYLAADPRLGYAIHRTARMLAQYAPKAVEVVDSPARADLRVWHVLGAGERTPLLTETQPYAVVQYCLQTTEHPHPDDWQSVWARAKVVWSYYDLTSVMPAEAKFYHAPLGVDDTVFKPCGCTKTYLVGTSGYVAGTEYIDAWTQALATQSTSPSLPRQQFHLGPRLSQFEGYPFVTTENGLTDSQLATRWGRCVYVSGLRAIEGFELPAAEGLVCGARPVLFARRDHQFWFGDTAEYLDEFQDVTAQLVALIRRPPRKVTSVERQWARARFDWASIVRNFWNEIV